VPTDPALVIPDPFPSVPAPIIPVDEEDIEDPDTGLVRALRETSPHEAERLARQKIRHTSQQMEKLAKKHTPSEPASAPSTKKSD
jgi:hypothetical protein